MSTFWAVYLICAVIMCGISSVIMWAEYNGNEVLTVRFILWLFAFTLIPFVNIGATVVSIGLIMVNRIQIVGGKQCK